MRRVGWSALAVLVLSASAACGSDDDTDAGAGLGSLEAALHEVPAEELQPGASVTWADLDEISEALDLERPDGSSWEDVEDWMVAIAFDPDAPVAVQLAETFQAVQLRDPEDFAAEHGWSIADVDAFVELSRPGPFFVGVGDLAIDPDLTAEVSDGIRGTRDGEGLLMTQRGDLLAAARESDPLERWSGQDHETLADDDGFSAVADALDDDVVSALITRFEPADVPWRYDTVGIGWEIDDGAAQITIAFHVVEVDADEAATALEAALRDAQLGDRPFAELLVLDELDADDDVVTATFTVGPEGTARTPLELLGRGALPFRQP